jgi:eukaryotic-like serine/threonine-protein kinase
VQVAAVVGQTFWDGAVSHLCGFDAVPILEDLTMRGIVVAEEESSLEFQHEFRFRHTLYREVAYAMLTRSDREIYHQRTAEWLARQANDRPDFLGMLAEHLVQGARREQALAAYLAAAEDRTRRGLYADTLKLVDGGLASAKDVPREIALPVVSQLWMWQGQALNALRRYDEASAAGTTALMLMSELSSKDLVDARTQAEGVLETARRASHGGTPGDGLARGE